MINIVELKEEDKGRWVIYNDGVGGKQRGCIKSWNDKWIFVVYYCDNDWYNYRNYTAVGTNPKDLTWG